MQEGNASAAIAYCSFLQRFKFYGPGVKKELYMFKF